MQLIAKTFQGLEEVLAKELTDMGAESVQLLTRAVQFAGDKKLLYRANLELTTALRILMPIHQFYCKTENHFYRSVQDFDWSRVMDLNDTFAIDPVVRSQYFTHSKYVSLKMKDAIADQFRDKTGKRPSVDVDNPTVRLQLHIFEDNCTILLDSSGESLHKRGYREAVVDAPVNEVLAAGMIKIAGWEGETDFLDPMCGSGTWPIEAAKIARRIPPQSPQRRFAFHHWDDFDKTLWDEIVEAARRHIRPLPCKIYASDNDKKAVTATFHNARNAGLENDIALDRESFEYLKPPSEAGLLMMNPPYDERLRQEDVNAFYAMIGERLKHQFAGWSAWIISSNTEALKHIGLRPSKKMILFNGALECRFQKFDLFKGKRNEHLAAKDKEA